MAFATYSDLQTLVANYSARTDLTTQIPDFITFAENRLSRSLRTSPMLSTASLTITSGSATIPTDLLELRDIYVDTNPVTHIEYLTPDQFYKNIFINSSGDSVYYSIIDGVFKFAPAPSSQTANILYYAKPEILSGTNTTNIYLSNYPDALLYATMAELETYLMNDARVQHWASLYDRAIENIKTSDLGSKYPNTALNVTAH
jgi:hypothetical protein